MEFLGELNERKIYYLSIREKSGWATLLPPDNWAVFTIVDEDDRDMLGEATEAILDNNVRYTCSAGELCSLTEDYFDEEIAIREVRFESQTGKEADFSMSPLTTMHRNFSDGFWYVVNCAINDLVQIDKIVCLDFTKRKTKKYLGTLIDKMSNGWVPNDDEIEPPQYDN
ncbi:MAG: hypothetical protein AB8F95_11790 [Bacteroidia bacterium]